MAKQLVGSYAHLRPDNPETFIASIAAVLAQYPLGVSEECADPRTGIARKSEFLSIKALVDWCDGRLSFYHSLANYQAPPPPTRQIESGPVSAEQCGNLMAKLADILRANSSKSPLDELIEQKAKARRLRIEEVYRVSEQALQGNAE